MDGGLLEYFDVFLLVFARMGGMVFINPVFSRKGVPFMVRVLDMLEDGCEGILEYLSENGK